MSISLDTFNEILHRHLRPWKSNHSPQKFQQLLNELSKETYQFQPHYDVDFPKPLNDKRRYYHTVIENAAIAFLNTLHNEIETAGNKDEKTYWVSTALNKQLKSKFREIKNLIERKSYQKENINLSKDDAYIIQYLKYQLVRLYLEVQDSYPDEIIDEPLTPEDILSNFFSDPPFEKPIIVPEKRKLAPDREVPATPKKAPFKFVQHNHEIRDPEEGVLLYHEIVDKPESLGRVEEILFEEKYIDDELKFLKRKGKQVVIAAVAHVLKQKKFFRDKAFHDGKRVTVNDLHIQRFISHRYNVKIDQQYRRFKKEEKLSSYLKDNLWIKNITSS